MELNVGSTMQKIFKDLLNVIELNNGPGPYLAIWFILLTNCCKIFSYFNEFHGFGVRFEIEMSIEHGTRNWEADRVEFSF